MDTWIVDGEECPIAFESQKLRPAEKNYSPYDGELLALVHCLRIFRAYLVNRPVIVRTDQKALQWLLDQRTLSRQQYRWLEILQELDLKLEWIAGKSNSIADALSCRPYDVEIGVQVNVLMDIDHSEKFLDNVRTSLEPEFSSLLTRLKRGKADARYSLRDGLIWFDKHRLLVPEKLRLKVLQDHHDSVLAGHPGVKVT